MLDAKKIIDEFDLKILNKKEPVYSREITGTTMQRLGLELSGSFVSYGHIQSVVNWGSKEQKFLLSFKTKKEREEVIKRALSEKTPMVILSSNIETEILSSIIEVCEELQVPISKLNMRMADINMKINPFIIRELAESKSIHGSLVIINGIGVMIIGKSGIGKSEALLELIKKGNSFVSDDTVIMKKEGNKIIGYPSAITKGFVESRGLGLIDIPLVYGTQSVKNFSNIDLVVELLSIDFMNKTDRLGNQDLKYEVFDTAISKIQIPVGHGRTLSTLIEAATNVFIVKESGHDPLKEITERAQNGVK